MSMFNWLKNKKTPNVKVKASKQNAFQDAAVAAAFAEAGEHETARSMIKTPAAKGPRQILVIGRGDSFSDILTDYALEMAGRLNSELIALNVTDAPLSLSTARHDEIITSFRESCGRNASHLKKLAGQKGITFCHHVEIGDQDEIIEKFHQVHSGLRYVLTEPDPQVMRETKGKAAIPVFALGAAAHA